ncbi:MULTISPECIES: baeRF2 domain-containing protein [Streptomyces]|uniref:Uncharacterized protein n=1 Tax=Streptomyces dengpaensis TaxID=2049881 RepID=A0ABN5IC45_9ACTN|nr:MULTISPECIES: hypothetical protein [Streptomyces]AVH60653.1 hypothetical protein C4B68_38310 [Streptomyces dengpaensis]PIB03546.1 hypothetical protein B1C81_36775 [Streptomyces sp. HG99]
MKLRFLNPLYERPGPVASVYLDTSRDIEEPDRAIQLRWRNLRDSLRAHDTDQTTVDAIAHVIGTDRDVAGPHGQAIFAAHGRLLLAEVLPEPPAHDTARYGMLPDTLPLALQHVPELGYAVVVVHRVHSADADGGEDELEVGYETGSWPMSRVASHSPPARRIPVEGWPKEAEQLIGELADGVDSFGREAIVLSGDPWATNALTRLAPRKLQDHFVRLKDSGHWRPEPGRALLEAGLATLFADRLPERDRQQLDTFRAQRARHRDGVEGVAATVAVLQRAQAQALILNQPVSIARPLWVGSEPTHIALSGADLNAFGLNYYWEEPPGSALIRAAVGTRAELIAVHRDELPLEDGLAVLLRYSGT